MIKIQLKVKLVRILTLYVVQFLKWIFRRSKGIIQKTNQSQFGNTFLSQNIVLCHFFLKVYYSHNLRKSFRLDTRITTLRYP